MTGPEAQAGQVAEPMTASAHADAPAPLPRRRAVLRAAGAAAVLGAGAACARIPTDSPVTSRVVDSRTPPGAPYVRALPPAEDASAEEVAIGFVQAGVGSEDDFATARAYLTEEASRSWIPTAGITIYSGSQELQVEEVSEGRLTVVLHVVALVDGNGVRSVLSGPVTRETEMRVEEVEGQWRLSEVPDGIFLSEAAFETLYAPARLYFLDPLERHLVPDHRWFPLHGSASAVLSALVAGPTAFLENAVTSRVPRTSGVSQATIGTGADGTVEVTVPAVVANLPTATRIPALSQIEASLRSMRALAGIRLVLDGQEVVLGEAERIERALPGHRPLAAGPTGVISLSDPGAGAEAPQLVPPFAELALTAPAIAQDGVLAAALDPAGGVVLLASTDGSVPLREAATGGAFIAPKLDDLGYVWTATRSSAGALLALSGRGPEHDAKVDAPWLAGREVRGLDIAADATRMILLSSDQAGTRVDLCAVVRGPDGIPTSLTEPVQIRTLLDDITQAVWYDEVAIIVLGTDTGADEQRAQVVDFATGREALPALASGIDRIAGSVVAETVWAGTRDGELLRSDGEGWTPVDIEGHDPAFY